EEKRISLPEVERRLKSSGLVKDACAVALTRKRQFLAVAIVFNDAGRKQFKDAMKLVMNNYFRDYLSGFLEATVLPKKWRFIDALPVNTEGKLRREDVEKLFDKNGSRLELISVEKPEPDKAVILVKFPETSDFFNGHFPTFKLLPAVVQVDLVIHWSEEYLLSSIVLHKIPRIKFCKPILPGRLIRLEFSYDKERAKVFFRYLDIEKNEVCSSGSVLLEKT
ncbi:MAG: AMP-dependent synthetase, partial [Fibrobacteraceae bacterium]|nr:AMP-dependent synthetase [Fibrobacteraceae bacterium]